MSLRLRRLRTSDPDFDAQLARVLAYSAEVDAEVESSVAAILADVRSRGDAAVLDYTRRFDGVDAASMAALEIGAGRASRGARRLAVGAARGARRPRRRAFARSMSASSRPRGAAGAIATATAACSARR